MLSLNVRGIRSLEKRKALFIWLQKQNADIIFLQETYSTKDVENAWKCQWKGPMFFAHGSNRSCGVLVLVKDNLEFEMKSALIDDKGRFILLDARVQGNDYIMGNIYAPNKVQEQCSFFEKLQEKIDSIVADQNQNIIIGGDFNVFTDPDLDCSGGTPKEKESTKFLNDMCLNFDLVDIWRIRNPDCKAFTWRQKKPLIQRRLDFWLISDVCQDEVEEANIKVAIKTDHSAITISFNTLDEQMRGPSYWKFNSSLIEDENYVLAINQKIPEWLEEFEEVTDKRVLWDLIKYRIRQFTMKFSKEKAYRRRQKLTEVETSLKQAEELLAAEPSESNLEKMEDLKMKYDSHFDYIARGAIIRSRATWYEKGEKSNKYFLGLESHRGKKSCIRKMFASDGTVTTNPKKIMKEIETFYSDLYAANEESLDEYHPLLHRPEIPKLSPDMSGLCEGRLSVKECFDCLNSFENNKSPGNDGLTVEFYKMFWNSLGNLLVDCLNYSYEVGELSNTQKQAVITLIEKKGKDKRKMGNWRPISLINVDAKIGSKAIATRIQKVLPDIIHFNQNAYVKGRTILDAVRTIDDILEYTQRKGINGLLVAIDFQKAFDSVSRRFMFKALSAFNFGPSLIHWVKTFYNNISSAVMNNGYTTTPFQVLKGVRQGDPLSPYLFIICLEILAIDIRCNKEIQGILVDKEEIKLEIFADDLTVFLKNYTSLNALFATVESFTLCSGLQINYEKTEAMFLGKQDPKVAPAVSSVRNISIKKAVKILGVHFTYNQILWKKLNFEDILKSIREKLHLWNWRNLTIIGRIQIVKTFVIPIFMYRAGLVCIHKDIIKEANKIIFNFIWKGKDKVKRSTLISDVENGGLRAPHLESIIKTQRIMCCKKLADAQPNSWKTILLHYLKPVGGKLLLGCGYDIKKLSIKLPKFYEECFQFLSEYSVAGAGNIEILDNNTRANIIVWNNKHICIDGKSIFHHALFEKGIITLEDLISDHNDFIVKGNPYRLGFTPMEVFYLRQILDALPVQWQNSLRSCGNKGGNAFVLNDFIKLWLKNKQVRLDKLISKNIYGVIRSKYETTPTAQSKFTEHYSSVYLDWQEIYNLPFKVVLDTKSREFQYKILNRYLTTNSFLHKIGLIASPLCSFCHAESESLEHLFISCSFTQSFWLEFICWCKNMGIILEELSQTDKLFGIWDREDDFLILNQLLITAKQYIYDCRRNTVRPSLRVFCTKLTYVYQLESQIAKLNNKEPSHILKWRKYINSLSLA